MTPLYERPLIRLDQHPLAPSRASAEGLTALGANRRQRKYARNLGIGVFCAGICVGVVTEFLVLVSVTVALCVSVFDRCW